MSSSASGANEEIIIFDENKTELERLRLQHVFIKDYMKDLIVAPIDLSKPGLRILDQGTADGLWLQEVRSTAAAQHEYVGTDIADVYFPTDPPSDLSFHHQSMNEARPKDWAESFDLVHSRFTLIGVGTTPVQDVISGLVNLVKPGGYIQFVEIDIEDRPGNGPVMQTFRKLFIELLKTISGGKGMNLMSDIHACARDCGLEDVEERIYGIPIAAQASSEEMKKITIESTMLTVHGIVSFLSQMPNTSMSPESMKHLLADLPKELQDMGGTYQMFVIWGRKPKDAG